MTTISTVPTYPVPGRSVRVKFTKSNSSADFIRTWMTDAPVGTEERQKIEDGQLGRMEVFTGDDGSEWSFSPTKGGTYRLTTQEYTRTGAAHGGSHQDDPDGSPRETLVGSENTITLTIGQRMVTECGVSPDLADLVVYVFDDTIRATTLETHGEVTPVLKNGATNRANMALATTAVRTDVSGLVDETVSDAIGDFQSLLAEEVADFTAHLSQSGVHDTDDTDNAIDEAFQQTPTPDTMEDVVNELLSKLRRHYLNDNGQGPGSAGTDPPTDTTPNPYHDNSGAKFDYTNLPLFQSVGGIAEAYRAIGDIYRSYEAHRVKGGLHDSDDSTNTLTAASLGALMSVHVEFFTQLAAISPTVPDTQTTGAVLLMTQVGAAETDPPN